MTVEADPAGVGGERAVGDALTDLLAGFIGELRQAGLPVSLTENLDAMEAVRHIPLENRQAFKYALAATMVKQHAHWRVFETVFEVYFSLRGAEYSIDDLNADDLPDTLEDEDRDGKDGQTGQGQGKGQGKREGLKEIRETESEQGIVERELEGKSKRESVCDR